MYPFCITYITNTSYKRSPNTHKVFKSHITTHFHLTKIFLFIYVLINEKQIIIEMQTDNQAYMYRSLCSSVHSESVSSQFLLSQNELQRGQPLDRSPFFGLRLGFICRPLVLHKHGHPSSSHPACGMHIGHPYALPFGVADAATCNELINLMKIY